jgi:hypothetical protein
VVIAVSFALVYLELAYRDGEISSPPRLEHSGEQPGPVILYAARQFHRVTGSPPWTGGLFDDAFYSAYPVSFDEFRRRWALDSR